MSASFFYNIGALHELFITLDRAGAGHDDKFRTADLYIPDPDDGVSCFSLSAGQLIGLQNSNGFFHPGQILYRLQLLLPSVVAYHTDDGLGNSP